MILSEVEEGMRVRVRATGKEYVVRAISTGFSSSMTNRRRMVALVGESRLYKAQELETLEDVSG
jgi:hypothetical protein